MTRTIAVLAITCALAGCSDRRRLEIDVVDLQGRDLVGAKLTVKRYAYIPLHPFRVDDVTTDATGRAWFEFKQGVDYELVLEDQNCEWIGGNFPFSEADIKAGAPLVVVTRATPCSPEKTPLSPPPTG